MRNLLKFAEYEFDCFRTKAEDARGDINYLWDLLISQSQATWETITDQHATQMKFAAVRSTIWRYSLALYLHSLSREIILGSRTSMGLGSQTLCMQRGSPRLQLAWHCQDNLVLGS